MLSGTDVKTVSICPPHTDEGPYKLKGSHTPAAWTANNTMDADFHFPTCCTVHKHVNTPPHNRDIMKHRDMETADEALQLILGFLPMNSRHPPLRLPQLLGSLSLRHSRLSYCPSPHAANLSPLTQDFNPFQNLQRCSSNLY